MPISFIRYIDITSSEGGTGNVPERDLITRIFTTNPLLPPKTVVEMESAAEVGAYFGTAGEEYLRAAPYFSWINKNGNSPQKISFSRWVGAASAPTAYGDPNATGTIAALDAINAGSLNITIGAHTAFVQNINLSTLSSYAAIAVALQTDIDAAVNFAGTTVTYSVNQNCFVITGPTTGSAAGTISFGAPTALSGLLGLSSPNTTLIAGADAETVTQTLTNSVQASTNFATFLFLTESEPLTLTQYEQAAAWNVTQNNDYGLLVPVIAANAAAWAPALLGYAGTAVTLVGSTSDFAEMLPGKVMAATNYNDPNASQNYMYQQDPSLTPTVYDDTDANTYDALRVNYYGQTQANGQLINFYQRGLLMGGTSSPVSMTAFFNEVWFKGQIAQSLITLQLTLPELPANNAGRILILSTLQSVIETALENGVISVGGTLSQTQINYINTITGDNTVAKQVQTIGYWVNITFTSNVDESGATEYTANYQIIYTKSNAVNTINGTHNLI